MTIITAPHPSPVRPDGLSSSDLAALASAVDALERTSFAARIAHLFGRHVGLAGRLVPARLSRLVSKAAAAALTRTMRIALRSLGRRSSRGGPMLHRTLAGASGALGGALGLAGLPLELPLSTTVMLRGIADIARAEGEDLSDPEAALACLQVFALGGQSAEDDMLEGGYFAMRAFLAKSVSEAARYIAGKSVVDEMAPVLVRLTTQIAARFGLIVSQKVAAQAVPLIGAAGGAAVNVAFMDHFQSLAKGHFTVRRLERAYGTDLVRREYERLARASMTRGKAATGFLRP